jgi:drug/metabolite transporter (DMT)-like permease
MAAGNHFVAVMTRPYAGDDASDPARLVGRLTAILSIAAGVIHISAAGDHTNLPALFVLFLVDAALQIGLGVLLLRRRPSRLLVAAAVAVMVGSVAVWLVSRTGDGRIPLREIGLPIAAGVGFGVFIVIISRMSTESVYWPLVAARLASLSVLTLVALAGRQPRWPPGRDLPLVATAGLFDAGGNVFVVLAAHAGRLDIAGVLASLYPASTVLLAAVILNERVSRSQFAGLIAALSAIVLITMP